MSRMGAWALREAAARAREIVLLPVLAVRLAVAVVPTGALWLLKLAQLVAFAVLLLPGFLRIVVWYFASPLVVRSVRYARHPRNMLDLYLPQGADAMELKQHARDPAVVAAVTDSDSGSDDGSGADVGNGREDGMAGKGRSGSAREGRGRPMVVFVPGGVWIIGYKAWGALLGRTLMCAGFVVACVDYRNFPMGSVSAMEEDVTAAVSWALRNAQALGADPSRVVLVGQSAGAHLSALSVCRQAMRVRAERHRADVSHVRSASSGSSPRAAVADSDGGAPQLSEAVAELDEHAAGRAAWRPRALRALVGVSGPYSLDDELVRHFQEHGLHPKLLARIMEGDLRANCPCALVREGSVDARDLPKIALLQGSADASVPSDQCTKVRSRPVRSARTQACTRARARARLADALEGVDAGGGDKLVCRVYKGATHTSPIIEGPMSGGKDVLIEDIIRAAYGALWEESTAPGGGAGDILHSADGGARIDALSAGAEAEAALAAVQARPLCPRFLVYLARRVMPF
eukprot:PRCOL_00005676-RA